MNKSLYLLLALIAGVTVAIWYNAQQITFSEPTEDNIIIGTNAEFQPFSFKQGEDIVGFDIDVVSEIFKRLHKQITIKDMPFDALIPEIQLGTIHVIAAGITPTPERAKQALFTKPHITDNPLVIIALKKNTPITGVQDLRDKEVVVNEGYIADTYMSAQEGPIVTRLSSPSITSGIMALQSRRADAFVAAQHSLQPYFDTFGTNDFQIIPIPGTEETSAFAISKYYPDLRDLMQAILDRMESDGTLNALKKKWNLL